MVFLIIISCIGAYLFFTCQLNKDASFFPLCYISVSSLVIYLCGLCNILYVGIYLNIILGYVLLLITLLDKRKQLKSMLISFCHPSVLFMLIGIIWAFVITRGVGISHIDDNNHWYRICKMLFAEDAFPRTPDLFFPSYTPGTAVWIYYITRIIGFGSSNCFFSQSILNLSACCSLLCVVNRLKKWRGVLAYICVSATSVLLCSADWSTYSLLVDGSLGLVVVSIISYLCHTNYRPDVFDRCIIIMNLSFLCLIKTSGWLFTVFIFIFYLVGLFVEHGNRPNRRTLLSTSYYVVIPVLVSLIYIVRNRFVFADWNSRRQVVSLERYIDYSQQKTPEQIIDIVQNMMIRIFSIVSSPQVASIWVCFLVLLLLYLIRNNKHKKVLKSQILYFLGIFSVYVFFLCLTYIFSMNDNEAGVLSSLDRYIGTFSVMMIGSVAIYFFRMVTEEDNKKFYLLSLVYLVTVSVITSVLFNPGYIFGKKYYRPMEEYDDVLFNALSSYCEESFEYTDDTYLIIWDDDLVEDKDSVIFQLNALIEMYFRCTSYYCCTEDEISKIEDIDDSFDDVDHIVFVGPVSEQYYLLNK